MRFSDIWNSFANATLKGVPRESVQYQQTRDAFYSGASVIMAAVKATGESTMDEDEAVRILHGLEVELHDFMTEVLAKGEQALRKQRQQKRGEQN